ncbi:hypothetical protein, partial [Pseudomonas syringae]|uniref:hypothetical protein n=1 Tax=Pseudomonas syringae TaxID=317 RepID=UPI001EE74B57
VNEHSEPVFNAASPSAATFRAEPRALRGGGSSHIRHQHVSSADPSERQRLNVLLSTTWIKRHSLGDRFLPEWRDERLNPFLNPFQETLP